MIFAYILNKNVVDRLHLTRIVYEFNERKITFLLQHLYVINNDTVYGVKISKVSTYMFRKILDYRKVTVYCCRRCRFS